MKTLQALVFNTILVAFLIASFSCNPESDADCNNLEVIQNTYSGEIDVNSGGQDPSADFEGDNDSGFYAFEWCNPQSRASLDFDITTSAGGSINIVLKDHNGEIVLDKTRPDGGNDSFSGVSDQGMSGSWTVEITFLDIKGDGSWSMHPGN